MWKGVLISQSQGLKHRDLGPYQSINVIKYPTCTCMSCAIARARLGLSYAFVVILGHPWQSPLSVTRNTNFRTPLQQDMMALLKLGLVSRIRQLSISENDLLCCPHWIFTGVVTSFGVDPAGYPITSTQISYLEDHV